jgi:dihydroxyacetone kinase
MRKIINQPGDFVDETIKGILMAYPEMYVLAAGERRAFIKREVPEGKVAIVTGGGSGHLPLFLGYVGEGLADGCAVGNVFASPSAKVMFEVTKAVHRGAGVLYLFGNYGGDRMNFEMAAEMAEDEGIRCVIVKGCDDVASAPKGEEERRRGVAGIFFAYKIAGAAAAQMLTLDKVAEYARRTVSATRSMGVALSGCTLPEVGKPSFEMGENEMELGMGIHGEPGITRGKLMSADEIADAMMERLLTDMEIAGRQDVALLINGLGATPREELYIVNRRVHTWLKQQGISVYRTYVCEAATSMEMAGLSISVMKLDNELKALLDASAYSPLLSVWR